MIRVWGLALLMLLSAFGMAQSRPPVTPASSPVRCEIGQMADQVVRALRIEGIRAAVRFQQIRKEWALDERIALARELWRLRGSIDGRALLNRSVIETVTGIRIPAWVTEAAGIMNGFKLR